MSSLKGVNIVLAFGDRALVKPPLMIHTRAQLCRCMWMCEQVLRLKEKDIAAKLKILVCCQTIPIYLD